MLNNNEIRIIGNVGADPVFNSRSKTPVTNLNVAVTDRKKDGDRWVSGDTTWFRVTVWGREAETVAETIQKGDRVVVIGSIKLSTYEREGQERSSLEINAETVALWEKPQQTDRASSKPKDTRDPW